MEIKDLYTGAVLFSGEAESIKSLLLAALESGADLRGADLRGANLEGEILSAEPIMVSGLRWRVLITEGFMRIGCQRHSHSDWAEGSSEFIAAMDGHATQFWSTYRDVLLGLCTAQAAKKAV